MESIFSRLLSLLAYHPDYPSPDLDEETQVRDLTDFARYILFYLSAVANEHNLSLIFHIAQRVKQTRDGITKSDEMTTRLHTLSDLAQATIRRFADIYSQQRRFGGGAGASSILQTYPGKVGVPSSIFARMNSHEEAQEVAEKNFLPEDAEDLLDRLVRSVMKAKSGSSNNHSSVKKRKPEASETNGNTSATKKARKDKDRSAKPRRSSTGTTTKTPKKKKKGGDGWSSDEDGAPEETTASAARRRSSRGTAKRVSYVDKGSDEDEMEVDDPVEENEEQESSDDEELSEANSELDAELESENEEQASDAEVPEEPEAPEESAEPEEPEEPPKPAPKTTETKAKRSEKPTALPTRRSSRRG